MRDYKRRLSAVQAENETLRRENEANKKRTKEWVDVLQDKLREFRKEKASWTDEAVALRGQVKDAQVCIDSACVLELLARRGTNGDSCDRLSWLQERNFSMILASRASIPRLVASHARIATVSSPCRYDKLKTEMDYLKPKIEQLGETEKNLERLRKNVTLYVQAVSAAPERSVDHSYS